MQQSLRKIYKYANLFTMSAPIEIQIAFYISAILGVVIASCAHIFNIYAKLEDWSLKKKYDQIFTHKNRG